MNQKFQSLSPWMQERAATLISILQQLDIQVTIFSAKRTPEEQEELLRKGWTKVRRSKHLTGDAMDLILKHPNGKTVYKLAGAIWTHLGGKWGGDFRPASLAAREFQHYEKPN